MPYKHDQRLKDVLAELEAAKKAAKEASLSVARGRSPLARRIRDLKRSLERSLKTREKRRTWSNWSDRDCELVYGREWRDLQARIASLNAELISTQTTLEIFDLEHTRNHLTENRSTYAGVARPIESWQSDRV